MRNSINPRPSNKPVTNTNVFCFVSENNRQEFSLTQNETFFGKSGERKTLYLLIAFLG